MMTCSINHLRNYILRFVAIVCACYFLGLPSSAAESTVPDSYSRIVAELATDDFDKKETAIRELARTEDSRTLEIYKAMLESRLYYFIETKQLVYLDESTTPASAVVVISGEKLPKVDTGLIDKISVNNKLRTLIGELTATLNLHHPDRNIRLAAVNELVGDLTAEKIKRFKELLVKESDEDIRDALTVAIALADIKNVDKSIQLNALTVLSDSLRPEAYNQISSLLSDIGDTPAAELQPLYTAAVKAKEHIETRRARYQLIETTFFGLSTGSILLLIAIGLSITFGVMGVINMAHGELMMLGAYTTYLVQLAFPGAIDYSLFIAIPLAFVVSGLVGIAIERGVIQFLYGRTLETLLATFGISLILQQLPRTFISAQNVTVQNPSWLSGSWVINPVLSITYNRLFIFVFAMLVFFGLLLILKKTRLGLQVRAVSQNRSMARAMGVRSKWVDAMTFGLGSGVAGIAGVALSQITNVGPNLGQGYIVDSFMVVVFGGVGNLWGMFDGALAIGLTNKYLEPWIGPVVAKILILIFIILFIQKRPRGLFPQKGRAADV